MTLRNVDKRYTAKLITIGGINLKDNIIKGNRSPNRLNLERLYAAGMPSNKQVTRVPIEIIALSISDLSPFLVIKPKLKLKSVESLGKNVGGTVIISPQGLKAVIAIQYTGASTMKQVIATIINATPLFGER
jgi:hypothetical protein